MWHMVKRQHATLKHIIEHCGNFSLDSCTMSAKPRASSTPGKINGLRLNSVRKIIYPSLSLFSHFQRVLYSFSLTDKIMPRSLKSIILLLPNFKCVLLSAVVSCHFATSLHPSHPQPPRSELTQNLCVIISYHSDHCHSLYPSRVITYHASAPFPPYNQ